MNILVLLNVGLSTFNHNSYCEPNTGNFLSELVRLGHNVTIYGQKNNVNEIGFHKYNLEDSGIIVRGIKRRKNKLWNYFLYYLKMLPYIYKSDFVYIFSPSTNNIAAIYSILFRIKYGLYIRGMNKLNSYFSKWMYKYASVILTVSDQFSYLVNKSISTPIAECIRPMIPYRFEDIKRDRTYQITERLNLLYLGRFDKEKGIAELLNAMKILVSKGKNVHLNLVGDGAYRNQMEQLMENLDIASYVTINYGIYDNTEKCKCYCNADIYILPTYHEGFPRTLYEAMIFGTPIITTMVGGIPFLMKENRNCYSIEPKSVDSIVTGIEFAIDNYDNMKSYAENAFKTIEYILEPNRPSHATQLINLINDGE